MVLSCELQRLYNTAKNVEQTTVTINVIITSDIEKTIINSKIKSRNTINHSKKISQ